MTLSENVHVLKQSLHLRSLHAEMRNAETQQAEFVFYANRVIRRLLDQALDLLPHSRRKVTTPTGNIYDGAELENKLCAVSVIRAGESMEFELSSMMRNLPIGKILIQRDKKTKQPDLLFSLLPEAIAESHVFLLEPMLATGGSAIMAIEQLLMAGVSEEKIILVNILTAPEGMERVMQKFPRMQIVTSSIERELNGEAYMVPGIGDFGDRYFGTFAGAVK